MPINDPLLYYTMDLADTSGITVTDRGSGGNNGTLVNAPTSVAGEVKEAYSFANASLQSILCATSGILANAAPVNWSIACWVKSTDVNFPNGRALYCERGAGLNIIKLGGFTGSGGSHAPKITLRNDAGTLLEATGATAIDDGAWHHVAATKHGTAIVIYVDGVQDATNTWSGVDSFTNVMPSNVGVDPIGDTGITAVIDEVRLYSRTLSAPEVAQLFAFTGASVMVGMRKFQPGLKRKPRWQP